MEGSVGTHAFALTVVQRDVRDYSRGLRGYGDGIESERSVFKSDGIYCVRSRGKRDYCGEDSRVDRNGSNRRGLWKSSGDAMDLQKLQFMPMHDAGHNDFFELPFETRREKDKKKFLQMKTLFDRKNHLDLLFMSLVLIDACEVPGIVVPEVAINQEINIGNVWCIASNCGSKLLDCYKNPQCRKSLDCVDACGMNDQVCTYTCIRSYQNREFEYLARCMLHSHNCLGNDAKRPEFPIVKPMKTFRGEALTHEVAEQIMQGHLGTERDGKKIEYFVYLTWRDKTRRTIIFQRNTKSGTPVKRETRSGTIQFSK